MATPSTVRSDARRNYSLRRALDRAREALLHRDIVAARRSILKAGTQGPLPVRPTRLLWEVVFRWLKAARSGEGGPLDPLFTSEAAHREIDAAKALARKGSRDAACRRFRRALARCPLSPEAIHGIGLLLFELRDLTEAALWLRLVPDILGPERRKGPLARGFVAESYLALARIELARGHRSRAAALALRALDVRPDSAEARSFIWDLEHVVGRPTGSLRGARGSP
jgi:hypothetical protein